MSINLSSPSYLLHLFIVDMAFTSGNISALLCICETRGLKSSVFDIFLCLTVYSAVTPVENPVHDSKDSFHPSLPGWNLAALYGLSLFYFLKIWREQEDDRM